MRNTIATILLFSVGLNAVYAASIPRGAATDSRIKYVQYDANDVVVLKGRYGYQTQIAFAPNETVQSVSLGDSLAWQAVPVSNFLFIKPVATSKTNMTVVTNVNSYIFQLDSEGQKTEPTYKLQFLYPASGYKQMVQENPANTFNPENINWKYSFTGDRKTSPLEVFDNGQFTYFKFRNDGMSRLPSVFMADKNRHETLVNFHMQGNYMVVHAVAKQFTLRDGAYVTSIYNDLAIGDWNNV